MTHSSSCADEQVLVTGEVGRWGRVGEGDGGLGDGAVLGTETNSVLPVLIELYFGADQ